MNNPIPIRMRRTGKAFFSKSVCAIRRQNKKQNDIDSKLTSHLLQWSLCLIAFVGIIGIVLMNFALSARAQCPLADRALKQGGAAQAEKFWISCALYENDETSQMALGRFYQTKAKQDKRDKINMLLYYHLAADNGNADAQVVLAGILRKMDENEQERVLLSSYMEQIHQMLKNKGKSFTGEMLHPYALLLLASEGAEQKWYYPTTQKTNAQAAKILEKYEISPEKKQMVLRQAMEWKQRKMQETAEEVLPFTEYRAFMETVYPEEGRADAFNRQQAVEGLKEKVKQYLK